MSEAWRKKPFFVNKVEFSLNHESARSSNRHSRLQFSRRTILKIAFVVWLTVGLALERKLFSRETKGWNWLSELMPHESSLNQLAGKLKCYTWHTPWRSETGNLETKDSGDKAKLCNCYEIRILRKLFRYLPRRIWYVYKLRDSSSRLCVREFILTFEILGFDKVEQRLISRNQVLLLYTFRIWFFAPHLLSIEPKDQYYNWKPFLNVWF